MFTINIYMRNLRPIYLHHNRPMRFSAVIKKNEMLHFMI